MSPPWVKGMNWKDYAKLLVAVIGAVAGAETAAQPQTWAAAFTPAIFFGALLALCGVFSSWIANTPTPPPPTDKGDDV